MCPEIFHKFSGPFTSLASIIQSQKSYTVRQRLKTNDSDAVEDLNNALQ